MSDSTGRWAILGAGGSLGQALVRHGGDRIAVTIARDRHVANRPVEDYGAVDPAWFAGADTVANCVGIARGDDETLDRINRRIAVAAARAARDAGVRRFIQVSSFSVYGHATMNGAATPLAPRSPYGISKAAADRELAALGDDRFAVALLRLPAILSPQRGGKVASLARLWRRLRFLPVPAGDIRRAMISVELAAKALLAIPDRPGTYHAADPSEFSYARLARAVNRAGGGKVRGTAVPAGVLAALGRVVPEVSASLWQDSRLDPAENLCIAAKLASDLDETLALVARR